MYMTSYMWELFPNFTAKEFACKCGCEKECTQMDISLLFILQALRNKYGKAVTIRSGHRCQKHNDSLAGAKSSSRHIQKKAADIYIKGVCDTEKGRDEVIEYVKTLPNFRYAYHNKNGKYPNMGTSVHIDVI